MKVNLRMKFLRLSARCNGYPLTLPLRMIARNFPHIVHLIFILEENIAEAFELIAIYDLLRSMKCIIDSHICKSALSAIKIFKFN